LPHVVIRHLCVAWRYVTAANRLWTNYWTAVVGLCNFADAICTKLVHS